MSVNWVKNRWWLSNNRWTMSVVHLRSARRERCPRRKKVNSLKIWSSSVMRWDDDSVAGKENGRDKSNAEKPCTSTWPFIRMCTAVWFIRPETQFISKAKQIKFQLNKLKWRKMGCTSSSRHSTPSLHNLVCLTGHINLSRNSRSSAITEHVTGKVWMSERRCA